MILVYLGNLWDLYELHNYLSIEEKTERQNKVKQET